MTEESAMAVVKAAALTQPKAERREGSASTKFASPFDANLLAARKRSQQEQLWDIFASYALQLSCEDPTRMRTANVVRLLQDCGVIDRGDSEAAKMVETEVAIICESFLRSHPSERDAGGKKLDFPAFLALLRNFASMAGDKDANRAYDSLVRTPRVAVAQDVQACRKLLGQFDDPLSKLFAFYAAETLGKLEKSDPKAAHASPAHMGYAECVAWGRKYGVISHGVLTTTEFATLYIDSLPKSPLSELDRVLTYTCFTELLVRLAKKSCQRQGNTQSVEHHLKGLFQLMWLASVSSSPRTLQITDLLKTDRLDVTRHFRAHFERFWKKERYEHFLEGNLLGAALVSSAPDRGSESLGDGALAPPPGSLRRSLRVQMVPASAAQSKTTQRRHSIHSTVPSAATSPASTRPALRRTASVSEAPMGLTAKAQAATALAADDAACE